MVLEQGGVVAIPDVTQSLIKHRYKQAHEEF